MFLEFRNYFQQFIQIRMTLGHSHQTHIGTVFFAQLPNMGVVVILKITGIESCIIA